MAKKLNPIRITDAETNEVYELDFSRETVKTAEQRGFKISELTDFPNINIPTLFYLAFRKNHKDVSKDKADKLLDAMGGLTSAELSRLVELYNQPSEALIIQGDGGRKNCRVTVEL